MEVDTGLMLSLLKPDVNPHFEPRNQDEVVDNALSLLRVYLYNFILKKLLHSVGQEFLYDFAPSKDSSVLHLLRFVLDKWLSTFMDSSICNHKPLVKRMVVLVKSVAPAGIVLVPSLATAREIVQASETLLIDVNPAGAAHISALSPKLSSSNTPIASHPQPAKMANAVSLFAPRAEPTVTSTSPLVSQAVFTQQPPRLSVILDGSNIAWRHGHSRFSIRGTVLALRYFTARQHPVVVFLPEARLRNEGKGKDYDTIKALQGSPNLVLTPDNDYDDVYICHFARANCALIVSNDAFKDHVYQVSADGERPSKEWATWFSACRLSFTFRGDQFLPNPAFNYGRATQVAHRLVLQL